MATCTFALDTIATNPFDGFGTHSGLWNQSWPTLTGTAGDLGDSAFADWAANMSLFTWLRDGFPGITFRESLARDRNYFAAKQASRLASLCRDYGPYKWIVAQAATPSKTMVGGWLRTRSMSTSMPDANRQAFQGFTSSTANWQAAFDALRADIDASMNAGMAVHIVGTLNENALASVGNEMVTYLDTTQFVDWIKEVWLGTNLSGGTGITDAYPWLRLMCDDPVTNRSTYYDAVLADATAAAEVDLYGYHVYGADAGGYSDPSTIDTTTGIYNLSKASWSEAGAFTSSTSYTAARIAAYIRPSVHATVYGRSTGPVIMFTSLRDVTAMVGTDYRGVTFTAKPLFDLSTSGGTFTPLPYWYAALPLLRASGKGGCTAYRAASNTADTNFDPASGCFVAGYYRDTVGGTNDGRRAFVYFNFSGSSRSDTLQFTSGGSGAGLSVRTRAYDCVNKSEGSWSAGSMDGSGNVALGSVADGCAVLVELYS